MTNVPKWTRKLYCWLTELLLSMEPCGEGRPQTDISSSATPML